MAYSKFLVSIMFNGPYAYNYYICPPSIEQEILIHWKIFFIDPLLSKAFLISTVVTKASVLASLSYLNKNN